MVGASGSGKSSVLQAGIVASVRKRMNWQVALFRPGAHPLEAMGTRDSRLPNYSTTKLPNYTTTQRLILVIDQFEEVFTLCREEAERRAFIDHLVAAAAQPGGRAVVLIALRADFYGACAPYETLRQMLTRSQEYIGPMSAAELRRAIEEPANLGGWELEPGLADLFLRDIGASDVGREVEPGALPLLSHALLETWLRRRGRTLTLSGYAEAGGVQGAIARTAEGVYARLSPEEQSLARNILLRLTHLGEGTLGTRRRVPLGELLPVEGEQAEPGSNTRQVLKTLADARLVTTTAETAEVAHEALIRGWGRLQDWLNEDREGLRLQRRLTEAAGEWQAQGREAGLLYRGVGLARTLEWASAHPSTLNLLEQDFLRLSKEESNREAAEREAQRQRELEAAQQAAEASQRAAEAERTRAEEQRLSARRLRRRALLLAAAAGLSLLLAAMVALLYRQSAQNARLAFTRELAAASINNLQINQQRSLLMALYAVELADLPETETALHQAVGANRLLDSFIDPDLDINATIAAFAPDGSRFATVEADGDIKIWGFEAGDRKVQRQPLRIIPGSGRVFNNIGPGYAMAFSPDGRSLAAADSWDTVKIWDSAGEKVLRTLEVQSGPIESIAYSPDGELLATAFGSSGVILWDPATGRELQRLIHPLNEAFSPFQVAFTPDGDRLVILGASDSGGIISIWERLPGGPGSGDGPLFSYLTKIGGDYILGFSISPDGKRLAAGCRNMKVYDLASASAAAPPELIAQMYGPEYPSSMFFTAGGSRLVSAGSTAGSDRQIGEGSSSTIKVWDAASGALLYNLANDTGKISSLWPSPDGNRALTIDSSKAVNLWDLSPEGSSEWFALPEIQYGSRLSPDGRRLVALTPGPDPAIGIWDLTASPPRLVKTLDAGPHCCLFDTSRDFTRLVTLETPGNPQTARIWDLQTGQMRAEYVASPPGILWDLDLSPDGSKMVTNESAEPFGYPPRTVSEWDLNAGKILFSLMDHNLHISDGAFSPDGTRFATGVEGEEIFLHIWDSASGAEVLKIPISETSIAGLVFSPDGKRVLFTSYARVGILLDLQSGKELFQLGENSIAYHGIAFSPDGTRLATGNVDGTVKLWDAATGQELVDLTGIMVAFSSDGKRLVTNDIKLDFNNSGTSRGFFLDLQDLLPLARSRLMRGWTLEECRQFLHTNTCPPSP